jgi:two-component system response regulator AtoC
LPALKDRKQDLPLLFKHFIEKFSMELQKNIVGLSKEAEKKLLEYDYPGNIRELSNIIECSMIMTNKEIIYVDDLPDEVKFYKGENENGEAVFSEDLIGLTLKEIERRIIKSSLARNNGSRKLTAEMLGISDKGLRNKIKEYKIY